MPSDTPAADVAVVGGGVIGIFAAWELARRGARVTLLDRGPLGLGSSFGNAGLLTPGAALPVSTPAALATGVRSFAGLASGISLRRPRNREEVRFLTSFALAARPTPVRAATRTLRQLALQSLDLYRRALAGQANVGFAETGWLHVYRSERTLAGGLAEADALARLGARWELLDGDLLCRREPALREGLAGGILYLEDAVVEPHRLLRAIAGLAVEASVELRPGVEVRAIRHHRGGGLHHRGGALHHRGGGLELDTSEGLLRPGAVVVAAGFSTAGLLRPLGIRLPIVPGKGHSLTYPAPVGAPRLPLDLMESHVVVAPTAGRVRITGGMGLLDDRPGVAPGTMPAMLAEARRYLRRVDPPPGAEAWAGFRPMTPDSLPIVGPLPDVPGIFVAAGHGMLGVTLAPVTAQLLAASVGGETPEQMRPLLPDRFLRIRSRGRGAA